MLTLFFCLVQYFLKPKFFCFSSLLHYALSRSEMNVLDIYQNLYQSARVFIKLEMTTMKREKRTDLFAKKSQMSDKELKIKSGILKRYLQEVESYRKEMQKQADKINALKESTDPDQYMIKKATEVQQENQQMLSLSLNNVKKSCADLKTLLESSDYEEGEMRTTAQELIQRASQLETL